MEVESPLTGMEGQKKLESMIFIFLILIKKMASPGFSSFKIHRTNSLFLVTANSEEKNAVRKKKKKSKLDFRKGHSGQRT